MKYTVSHPIYKSTKLYTPFGFIQFDEQGVAVCDEGPAKHLSTLAGYTVEKMKEEKPIPPPDPAVVFLTTEEEDISELPEETKEEEKPYSKPRTTKKGK